MTATVNDNNPIVDNVTLITFDDNSPDSVEEDFFFCRKCNKIFKSLPHYVEHKIKDEHYRLIHTRSEVDRRLVLPKLLQRKFVQRNKKKPTDPEHAVSVEGSLPLKDLVQPIVADKNFGEEESDRVEVESPVPDVAVPKKRGRKRKVLIPKSEQPTAIVAEQSSALYTCKICDKKFRREATLRWHQTYDHASRSKKEEDSESSEEEGIKAELDDNDTEYKMESPVKGFGHVEEVKKEVDICLVNEAPQQELKKEEVDQGEMQVTEAKEDSWDRPFACNVCGRRFKELTVLKAHGVVHSDERKFVCKFENCPYGFKTKGALVRHERRHTGERPYVCERCNRAFSESGALARHMKARRNCSETPDSAYPRYMKSWTYHPNIPAVLDPNQRDALNGPSTLPISETSYQLVSPMGSSQEVHFIITDVTDSKLVASEKLDGILPPLVTAEILTEGGMADSKLEIKLEKMQSDDLEQWVASKKGEDRNYESPEQTVISVAVEDRAAPSCDVATDEKKSEELVVVVDPDFVEFKNALDVEQLKATQCHVCRKDFESIEGLELHLRSHLADQPTRCGLCHFLSNDREELRQHILTMHYDSLNDIETSVLSMEEDSSLTKLESMDKKVVLRNALMAVKQLYSIKKSKTAVEVEKPPLSATGTLQCMVCNRMFRGNSYLRQHMRSHTGDRPYRCLQCDRSFTTRDILKKHMYVHKEQRDFKCGECGKLFKSLSHVKQHLRIHKQDRAFRCSVCDKMFKTQHTLKVHLRTHSGFNPYKCQVCGHFFRERGSLQRHMRLHTGERPYKCHKCNRTFAEHSTLIRHHKAKIPCTINLEAGVSSEIGNSTMLDQFSSVVADTQYILPEVDTGQQYIIPTDQDQEVAENYVILQNTGIDSQTVENLEVITEERVTSINSELSEDQNQESETLEIFDASTGESYIIIADKSIFDLVKQDSEALNSEGGISGMQKIKELLEAARKEVDDISLKCDVSFVTHEVEQEVPEPVTETKVNIIDNTA